MRDLLALLGWLIYWAMIISVPLFILGMIAFPFMERYFSQKK